MEAWTNLKDYLRITNSSEDGQISQCYYLAQEMVDKLDPKGKVPPAAKVRAVLAVGAELYWQRDAKNGISQFASFDGAGMRIARDPLVAAYPFLSPWVVFGL